MKTGCVGIGPGEHTFAWRSAKSPVTELSHAASANAFDNSRARHLDMAAMNKIRRLSDSVSFIFGMRMLLMLPLVNCPESAGAGNRVVAWGAGKIFKPSDNNDYGQSIVPPNLTNAVMVAAGWRHSLALKADGTLEGWGDDSLNQTNFLAGSNYISVACGDLHSVALKATGAVAVAGDNFYDQQQVPTNLNNVVSIACGFYHTLALTADGTVVAWGAVGSVNYGQGTNSANVSNVVAIAAGGYHNLVLKQDGTLFAWGLNAYGETNIPPGLSNVVAIAAGSGHNLALRSDGTIFAWGLDNYGQVDVPAGLSNVVAIAAGGWHNLALKRDGTVVAWGAGTGSDASVDYGQNIVPANLTNVIQVAAGDLNSLALVGNAAPITQAMPVQPRLTTNGFSFWIPTQNGRVYQTEFNSSLLENAWQPLPLKAGTGGAEQFTDKPALSSQQRFYRVLQW